ncbi:MAG: hypothetical protein U1E05_27315, partial [Patescibacteria group bacterium]|nr:hypothetical protein [Patescibacteria group bacterium]
MTLPIAMISERVAAGRRLLIYGAGSQGRGVLRSLRGGGLEPAGFIDRNPSLHGRTVGGLSVHGPSILDEPGAADRLFVVVAAFFFEREIANLLESRGFISGVGYVPYSELKPRDYAVEVSGVCNLRCIACPRASRPPAGRNAAMMDLATFGRVLDKIRREDPFVGNLQLYQWGEPTLNRELPAMIRLASEQGFLCSISSNLNHAADFRALVEARPECLRLSVSGVRDEYAVTHTGGNWDAFLRNVETIGRLRHELYPEMKVELYYHCYRHSLGAPLEQVAALSERLGFEFHPIPAYLISLDDVLAYGEGRPLPAPAREARDLLLVDLDEGLRLAKAEAHLPCDALRVIQI